jgi:hypothetical protein
MRFSAVRAFFGSVNLPGGVTKEAYGMLSDIHRTVHVGSFSRINVEPPTVPPISKYKIAQL